jgi:glycosyltransferase involved in cell wall biosynthesis
MPEARPDVNILLINHYAGSPRHGMEYRPYYLAREWVRAGHTVTIVAASESHVRSRRPNINGPVNEESIDGIRYVWLKTPPYQGNTARRVLNMFAFVLGLFRYARQITEGTKPDLVIASSTYPLDIFPAARLARRCGARLVFEVHDLWPLSPIELGGMSRRHPFIVLLQWAEDYAYRTAAKVVSMLPKAAAYMETRGMRPDQFIHIPNGVDLSEWDGQHDALSSDVAELIQRERAKAHFLVGYAGAHGIANALHNLIQAAGRLRGQPVTFLLVGQGPEKAALQGQANELGLENVIFLPTLQKTAVPKFLRELDALYIGLQRQPLFRFGISPNKLMDYMMSGKPVVQAIEAGNNPVADARCGVSVPAEDPGALADAIVWLMRLDKAERESMGVSGRRYVEQHHDYRVLAQQFLEAVG